MNRTGRSNGGSKSMETERKVEFGKNEGKKRGRNRGRERVVRRIP